MRETFHLGGPLHKCETIEEAHRLVSARYPRRYRCGSTGHWTWTHDSQCEGQVLAEAWMGSDNLWHLRIKP